MLPLSLCEVIGLLLLVVVVVLVVVLAVVVVVVVVVEAVVMCHDSPLILEYCKEIISG